MNRLRVGTWNIIGGRGADNSWIVSQRSRFLEPIARAIYEQDLQVVFLQEVDVRSLRSGMLHQPQYLAGRLSEMSGRPWMSLFGRAINIACGAFGNAIISSIPIERVFTLHLQIAGQSEQRVFMFGRLLLPDQPVGVGSFHLSVKGEGVRQLEAAKIKLELARWQPFGPLIIGGDSNGERNGSVYQRLLSDHFQLVDLGPEEGYSYGDQEHNNLERMDFLLGYRLHLLESGIFEAGELSDHHLVWAECQV
jgi:endonuclease/exonuclease/phosphatase family metal-dependent hydrolase